MHPRGRSGVVFARSLSPRSPSRAYCKPFLSFRGALTSQILRKCLKAFAHSKRAFRSSRSGTLRLKTRYHPFRSARSRLFKDLFLASSDNAPPLNGGYMWGRIPPGASQTRPPLPPQYLPAVTAINANGMPKSARSAKKIGFGYLFPCPLPIPLRPLATPPAAPDSYKFSMAFLAWTDKMSCTDKMAENMTKWQAPLKNFKNS